MNSISRAKTFSRTAFLCAGIVAVSGCANLSSGGKPEPVAEIHPGYLMGYLSESELPNSLALLPSAPDEGSATFQLDKSFAKEMLGLRGTPRWELAALDADLSFPNAAGTYSCALDAPISEEVTPHLYQLLRRTLTDAGLSTYSAKNHYNRTRPFMMNGEPTCSPGDEAALRKDGSYPSGHTSIGWSWALVLAELAPEKADAILARGLAFGESRNVCNVHWHSDVVQGRIVATATVARLHADSEFQADMKAAKAELDAVRAQGLAPTRDCSVESAALAQ